MTAPLTFTPVHFDVKNVDRIDSATDKQAVALLDLSRADELDKQRLRCFIHKAGDLKPQDRIQLFEASILLDDPDTVLQQLFKVITDVASQVANLAVRIILPNDTDLREDFFSNIARKFSTHLITNHRDEMKDIQAKTSIETYDFKELRKLSQPAYAKWIASILLATNNFKFSTLNQGDSIVLAFADDHQGTQQIKLVKLYKYDKSTKGFDDISASTVKQDADTPVNLKRSLADRSIAKVFVSAALERTFKLYNIDNQEIINDTKGDRRGIQNLKFIHKGFSNYSSNVHFLRA